MGKFKPVELVSPKGKKVTAESATTETKLRFDGYKTAGKPKASPTPKPADPAK